MTDCLEEDRRVTCKEITQATGIPTIYELMKRQIWAR